MEEILKNIWVIIPAYNSAKSLPKVIRDISSVFPTIRMVVVNDGSTDGTGENEKKWNNTSVLRHESNQGVGAAIKTGARFALQQGAEICVTIGADNQRDVKEIQTLIDPLLSSSCDMTIGSRFLGQKLQIPFNRRWGNLFLTTFLNLVHGTKFTDVTSGFRGFSRKVAGDLDQLDNRYPFDADFCIRATQRGYQTTDVAVKVFYEEGFTKMKSTFLTGLSILWMIVWRKLKKLS